MVDDKYLARFVKENVDPMQRILWNKVGLREGFTQATAKTTLDIAYWLWSNGYAFACEVRMKNNLRADIMVPELVNCQVIEIMDSETPSMLSRKEKLYDELGVSVIGVPANSSDAIVLIKAVNGLK